jgi:inactivated superfamily I helicase
LVRRETGRLPFGKLSRFFVTVKLSGADELISIPAAKLLVHPIKATLRNLDQVPLFKF